MDHKYFPRSPTDLFSERDDHEAQQDQLLAVAKSMKASKDREKRRSGKGKPDIIIHREENTRTE